MEMKKLAVLFPGIGYTADRPLLYYSGKAAAKHGYEIRKLSCHGFPAKPERGQQGTAVRYRETCFAIAQKQAEEMFSGTDLTQYEEVLLIGKSLGTVVAAKLAEESAARNRIRLLLYTPLEETFSFRFGSAAAFTGTADPWVSEPGRIEALCAERGISCLTLQGANHSLETGEMAEDLRNLRSILEVTERFLTGMAPDYAALLRQAEGMLQEEPRAESALANVSALLMDQVEGLNWAGFYLVRESGLTVGPFQGKPACIHIAPGRGVCGTAAAENRTVRVPDVHQFAGHIACDSASCAELVIPIHAEGKVKAVLDLDSPRKNRFSDADQAGLEALVRRMEPLLHW